MAEKQPEPEAPQAEQGEAPQSPPLPSPHKAVAPGPRAAMLQKLFDQSLARMLGKISWENLVGCYPTVAAGAPGMLRGVRKTMVERLETMCRVGSSLFSPFRFRRGRGGARGGVVCAGGEDEWLTLVQNEFGKILEKREVVPKLNELEDLIGEAARRREADPSAQPTPYVTPAFLSSPF